MKEEITDAYTRIEEARTQMRGLAKACTAFGNTLGDEDAWFLAGRAAADCERAMAKAQERLDEMKLQIYGGKAHAGEVG